MKEYGDLLLAIFVGLGWLGGMMFLVRIIMSFFGMLNQI